MADITTRAGKGLPLTHAEVDENFENLNTDKAELNSPALTGTPTSTTPAANDNTTRIATTQYVQTELLDYAPLASPALSGTPTAPTAALDDNSSQIASTAYVQNELVDRAPLASPALSGTPTAPTPPVDNNSTRIATTAYVQGELTDRAPLASPALTGAPTAPTAAQGTNTTQIATTAFVNAEIAADTADLAPQASPALTGVPTAPTAAQGTNTTQIATTAFVNTEIAADTANLAPLASPALSGTPTAPTPPVDNNSTRIATTAYVQGELTDRAPLASPALTGTPTAPTAAADTNTTQIATTAYVQGELTDRAPLASPTFTGTPSAPTANQGTNTTQLATTAYVQTELVDYTSTVDNRPDYKGLAFVKWIWANAGVLHDYSAPILPFQVGTPTLDPVTGILQPGQNVALPAPAAFDTIPIPAWSNGVAGNGNNLVAITTLFSLPPQPFGLAADVPGGIQVGDRIYFQDDSWYGCGGVYTVEDLGVNGVRPWQLKLVPELLPWGNDGTWRGIHFSTATKRSTAANGFIKQIKILRNKNYGDDTFTTSLPWYGDNIALWPAANYDQIVGGGSNISGGGTIVGCDAVVTGNPRISVIASESAVFKGINQTIIGYRPGGSHEGIIDCKQRGNLVGAGGTLTFNDLGRHWVNTQSTSFTWTIPLDNDADLWQSTDLLRDYEISLTQRSDTGYCIVTPASGVTITGPTRTLYYGDTLFLRQSGTPNVWETRVVGGLVPALNGRKNILINGGMDVWQRQTTSTNIGAGVHTADRWFTFQYGGGSGRAVTYSRVGLAGNEIPVQHLYYAFRINETNPGTGYTEKSMWQAIEDARHFAGRPVCISFWAKAAAPITLPGIGLTRATQVNQSNWTIFSPGVVSSPTYNVTTTWQRFSHSFIMPDMTGVALPNYEMWSGEIWINIKFPVTGTFTLDITGVQFELGSTPTPFEARSFQDELMLCKRYYQHSYSHGHYPLTSTDWSGLMLSKLTGDGVGGDETVLHFTPEMRCSPTLRLIPPRNFDSDVFDQVEAFASDNEYSNVEAGAHYLNEKKANVFVPSYPPGRKGYQFHWTADAEI